MRLRVHEDGSCAVQTSQLPEWWFLLAPGAPWLREDEVHGPGWSEAVVLVPTETDGRRLAVALAAAWGVDDADVAGPEQLADAIRRLAEEAEGRL